MEGEKGRQSCQLTDLVEQHYALLYRIAYRLSGSAADAEDLTQQTFLKAQSKLDQLRDTANAKAWLCAILRNVFRKGLRDDHLLTLVSLDAVPDLPDDTTEIEALEGSEVQAVLNELPEEFRTPLVLFYFEEFSYKDIADQMEVPIGTVMSRLARGRSYLRRGLVLRQPARSE